jgi:hypothetical protein
MPSPKKPAAKKAAAPQAAAESQTSQKDVAKALFEKLHGAADKAAKPPAGGPPKPGFNPKGGFNVKNQVKGGSGPRRTQGKGG